MELLRALGAVAEAAGPGTAAPADALGLGALDRADHTELFTLQLPPYASIYLGEEGMLGGEARDRIAGFWRVAGATPPAEPDHLAALLSAHASLVEGEESGDGRGAWRRLRHAFFWEHLASWLPAYLARVDEVAPPTFRPWGELLRDALTAEAGALGPPSRPAAHLRVAPAAEESDGPAFLAAVLAPARSGLILTRRDLARAADALELGLRLGERRYILENFFNQAPTATAHWLADEAERQAELYAAAGRAATDGLRSVLGHWSDRARATAERLGAVPTTPPTLQEATHA